MPKVRTVLNGFTASEVNTITGLSRPMIDYLSRHEFLRPAYSAPGNPRGRVRYYSYRDLVVARLIQRLRVGGVQLSRLKEVVCELASDGSWTSTGDPIDRLRFLVSDGRSVQMLNRDGFLDEVAGSAQRSFSFVVNVTLLRDEVRALVPAPKRDRFSMDVVELEYEAPRKRVRHG